MGQRSTMRIRTDIESGKYNFSKSKQSAPVGYDFLCNYNLNNEIEETRIDFRTIEWYTKNGYMVLPTTYNMYGERIYGYVAIYRKKELR